MKKKSTRLTIKANLVPVKVPLKSPLAEHCNERPPFLWSESALSWGVQSNTGVQNVQKILFGVDKERLHKTNLSLIRGSLVAGTTVVFRVAALVSKAKENFLKI